MCTWDGAVQRAAGGTGAVGSTECTKGQLGCSRWRHCKSSGFQSMAISGKCLNVKSFAKQKLLRLFFFILALKNNLLTKLCCVCSAPERHLTALACGFSAAVCTQSLQVRLRSQGRGSAPHLQLPTFTSQQRLQGSALHQFRQHQFSIKLLHACSYRSKFPHGQLA